MSLLWLFLNGFCMTAWSIITPPSEYSVESYFEMARKQIFVLDAFELNYAGVNPSMIRDPKNQDHIIMVWRKGSGRNSRIGYTWTNSNTWNPLKDVGTIATLDNGTTHLTQTEMIGEDSRISCFNGQLLLTYNMHHGKFKTFHYSHVFYHQKPKYLASEMWKSAVIYGNEIFYNLHVGERNIEFQSVVKGEQQQRHQKNWSPFEFCPLCVYHHGSVSVEDSGHYRAQLLFSYSLQPHIVVQTHDIPTRDSDSNHPIPINCVAETVFATEMLPEYEWQWGEMRGGTPALLVGDSYLAFFHSSGRLNHKTVISYVMGAYMFEKDPPFAITHMSPEPIVHPTMVNESLGWSYKIVDYIVFPMGFVFDDRYLYLSYGKNDKSGWVLKLEKEGLIASLRPVKTKVLGASRYHNITGEIERQSYQSHAPTGE